MKAFIVAAVVGVGLFGLVAAVPHAPDDPVPDDLVVNAKVDARLKEVLSGLLRAQSEQASLSR